MSRPVNCVVQLSCFAAQSTRSCSSRSLRTTFQSSCWASCSATLVLTAHASRFGFLTLFLLRCKIFRLCCASRKKAHTADSFRVSVDRPVSLARSVSIWVHNKFSLISRQLHSQISSVQICAW